MRALKTFPYLDLVFKKCIGVRESSDDQQLRIRPHVIDAILSSFGKILLSIELSNM